MRIFLICSVRNASEEERAAQRAYVEKLEAAGHEVYWPPRNTNQDDPVGLRICEDNRRAIESSDEIRIWSGPASEGMMFDFAMAHALGKRIVPTDAALPPEIETHAPFLDLAMGLMDCLNEVPLRWKSLVRHVPITILGAAFALKRKITLLNPEDVKRTPHKSFENVLLALTGNLK